jgi:hypothetical protein
MNMISKDPTRGAGMEHENILEGEEGYRRTQVVRINC